MQDHVDDIRKMYKKDWDSTDVQRQQMGCALYFIDQLALRAGHEKDEDEADTVGCCTLKVHHVLLHLHLLCLTRNYQIIGLGHIPTGVFGTGVARSAAA